MRKLCFWTCVVVCAAFCAELRPSAKLLSQEPPASAPDAVTSATLPADDPAFAHWKEVAQRLGSPQFTDREATQLELEKIGYESRETLAKMAEAQTDPEVKARLLARVEQIDEQLALDPPPISLHVKNAKPADLALALGKALGQKLTANPALNTPYTLDVDNVPFWEAYAALSRQTPLSFFPPERARFARSAKIGDYDQHGGFVAFATTPQHPRTNSANGPAPQPPPVPKFTLAYVIAADPRMTIVEATLPRLTAAFDKEGKELWSSRAPAKSADQTGEIPSNVWPNSTIPDIPEKTARAIASARGDGRFVVQITETRRTFEDIESRADEILQIGDQSFTLTRLLFVPPSNIMQLTKRVQRKGDATPLIHATVFDAAGKLVWQRSLTDHAEVFLGPHETGPFRLILSIPDKTKTVEVPFELRDFPLP